MNIYLVRCVARKKNVKVSNDIMGVFSTEDAAYECISDVIKESPEIEEDAYFDIEYMGLDERADENTFLIGDEF